VSVSNRLIVEDIENIAVLHVSVVFDYKLSQDLARVSIYARTASRPGRLLGAYLTCSADGSCLCLLKLISAAALRKVVLL